MIKAGTILVTGVTGFLGTALVSALVKNNYKVIGVGHSESNIKKFELLFGEDVPVHLVDISSDFVGIKNLIRKFSVDYIIHSAALKHVNICEKNPTRAVDVNVIGSKNIIRAAIECDVKNVIGISTDKAINPLCVYGVTKKMMEEMFLEHNFGIFQGVNFFFSTGSVLDIWDRLRLEDKPIMFNTTSVRYFCLIEDVCNKIIDLIDYEERFTIDKCYEISIHDLQRAFSTYHNYWNTKEHKPLHVEKDEEDLPLKEIKIIKPKIDQIVKLLHEHYERTSQ